MPENPHKSSLSGLLGITKIVTETLEELHKRGCHDIDKEAAVILVELADAHKLEAGHPERTKVGGTLNAFALRALKLLDDIKQQERKKP